MPYTIIVSKLAKGWTFDRAVKELRDPNGCVEVYDQNAIHYHAHIANGVSSGPINRAKVKAKIKSVLKPG